VADHGRDDRPRQRGWPRPGRQAALFVIDLWITHDNYSWFQDNNDSLAIMNDTTQTGFYTVRIDHLFHDNKHEISTMRSEEWVTELESFASLLWCDKWCSHGQWHGGWGWVCEKEIPSWKKWTKSVYIVIFLADLGAPGPMGPPGCGPYQAIAPSYCNSWLFHWVWRRHQPAADGSVTSPPPAADGNRGDMRPELDLTDHGLLSPRLRWGCWALHRRREAYFMLKCVLNVWNVFKMYLFIFKCVFNMY